MIKILVPIAAIVVAATPAAAQGVSFTVPTPGYNQGYNQGYEPEYNRGYEPEYASPRRQWYQVNRGITRMADRRNYFDAARVASMSSTLTGR